MDYMDIDQIEEVPDTPDRFVTSCSNNNDGNNSGSRGNGSSSCRVIDRDVFFRMKRNESREKGKGVAVQGSRRLFVRPDSCSNSSGAGLGSSPSSKNVVSPVANARHDKGKSLCSSSSLVDLTDKNKRGDVFGSNNAMNLGPRSGKGGVFGCQHKAENGSSSLASTPPRGNRHKRLVRNGCISPHNISKSKHVPEKNDIAKVTNKVSDGQSSNIDIKEIIAEAKDAHRLKGKGVFLESPEAKNAHLSQRRSLIFKESTDESDGWLTTHNTTRKVDPASVNGDQHLLRGKSTSSSVNGQLKNGKIHANNRNESTSSIFNNHFEDLEIDSTQVKERAQFTKRQREGVGSSSTRGCDVAYVNNADIPSSSVNVGSSTSRLTRNKNRRGTGSSDQVVVIDEPSHEGRHRGSNSNEDQTVRALQLEADERLARELQEQLYNETPSGLGIDEMESHNALAMAMQQERGLRAGGRPASHARSNASRRVVSSRTQAPTSTGLSRLRARFPGRPRTISSTRGSIFPPNMDVDMRMQILEALEAFNDMEMPNNLLHMGRDFNENDYEMLLALDDNNHHHGGATHAQINNLPQSTVQAENLQECAICLEAPNVGETIRHLPCFHKFHKECIDEWLRRKTSCPVCKSSVT